MAYISTDERWAAYQGGEEVDNGALREVLGLVGNGKGGEEKEKGTRARVGTIRRGTPKAKARQAKGPKGTTRGKARAPSMGTAITAGCKTTELQIVRSLGNSKE